MILMIDNYDSFTYNLVQYLTAMREEVRVVRNDAAGVEDIHRLAPDQIVISPGPGTPDDAGVSVAVVKEFSGSIPILGICLGHQCIGKAFGGEIIKAQRLMHGKASEVEHTGEGIFTGIKSPLKAIRYHSLAIDPSSLPACLDVTARSEEGEIMGISHRNHITIGLQFHPESILTPCGKRLLGNFLKVSTGSQA
ncbi:MAG: aminodeoxychorismate/anthranilate synthase component II [Candidatus Pacebacteria bacterium]|nr:aminodeoxychorismate/anthranilate synthase component II [Candidatus Paceibacterota bacterium]